MTSQKQGATSAILQGLMAHHIVRGKSISANELAKRTGVPQSTITRILKGDVKESRAKSMQKLADYFKVSLTMLRGDEPVAVSVSTGGNGERREPGSVATIAGATSTHLTYVTDSEIAFLDAYRSANQTGQAAIEGAVRGISAQYPRQKLGEVKPIK